MRGFACDAHRHFPHGLQGARLGQYFLDAARVLFSARRYRRASSPYALSRWLADIHHDAGFPMRHATSAVYYTAMPSTSTRTGAAAPAWPPAVTARQNITSPPPRQIRARAWQGKHA